MLFDEGVFCSPVISPAVPEGEALIRTSYMAIHTDEHLDHVLEAFEKVGKNLGIIPGTYKPVKSLKIKRTRRILKRIRIGTQRLRLGSKRWTQKLFWRFWR
ncbi:MAG: hypothetical protein ACK4JE_03850, partial [Endomicrobiia bacterium]